MNANVDSSVFYFYSFFFSFFFLYPEENFGIYFCYPLFICLPFLPNIYTYMNYPPVVTRNRKSQEESHACRMRNNLIKCILHILNVWNLSIVFSLSLIQTHVRLFSFTCCIHNENSYQNVKQTRAPQFQSHVLSHEQASISVQQ